MESSFSLITLKNCINYLERWEIERLIKFLKPNGVIIANSFKEAPNYRVKGNEAVYSADEEIHHYYIKSEQEVYYHTFKDTDMKLLKDLGFSLEEYNNGKSILIKYIKKE